MTYRTIEQERCGRVSLIRLNRPERMNAVIEEMYLEIQAALEAARADAGIRCLVLTGSILTRDGIEKQAFCAGADLKEHAAGKRSPEERRRYLELAHDTVRLLYEFPGPVIAAVNGPARGAGTEMALSCDFVLMAEEATLALPETGLGTFVGGGLTHILPRLVGLARAKELVYTGRVVDGRTAVEMGLALQCLPVEDLLDRAMAFAGVLAARATVSVAFAKDFLQHSPNRTMREALDLEAGAILACMETDDWQEGLRAFAEKRNPDFRGS